MDVTLGSVLHRSSINRSNSSSETEIAKNSELEVYQVEDVISRGEQPEFQGEELLTYGTPVRRHVGPRSHIDIKKIIGI